MTWLGILYGTKLSNGHTSKETFYINSIKSSLVCIFVYKFESETNNHSNKYS